MESLFRQLGIYSHVGQRYEPVDRETLLYYKESTSGQILEEGITEAGSLSSFIAAGTAYSTHGLAMLPIFLFYSMFGFQRVGDLIWAASDMRCRGILVGATAGRTTLAGEGLQHQDGHSHLLAYPPPNVLAYDPAFAYEIAVIMRDAVRRILSESEDLIYYLTAENETYKMPAMPQGVDDRDILRGMYRFASGDGNGTRARASLLGSGAILNEAIAAQRLLADRYGVSADVYSVTSYKELHRDAISVERHNSLNPTGEQQRPYVSRVLGDDPGPVVAASDYVKALPCSIARWIPGPFVPLGTDGFGRSDDREALRDFFEVDARHIAFATLSALFRQGIIEQDELQRAIRELEIDQDRPDPITR
jgi:pyruvate dehydrogenase E1 component